MARFDEFVDGVIADIDLRLNTDCQHCQSKVGHRHWCPLINRAVAETLSALNDPTILERFEAHALGIKLG